MQHGSSNETDVLERALQTARHILPTQGPIGVFIHHNTLHAFQHFPFHEAVARASAELDTQGYLSETQYRACFARGRIEAADLDAVLAERIGPNDQAGPLPLRR